MKRLLGALSFAAVVSLCGAAQAQIAGSAATITLAIGTSVGGGYDLYGRLAARHLGRAMKGAPLVVPSNMPGAGQLIMTNWLYNVAPRNGLAIGLVPSTTALENLFGNPRANFDARNFNWIGSLNGHTAVAIAWAASPLRTAEDLFQNALIGGGAPSSDVTIWPKLLNNIVGTKIKLVAGYVGTSQIALAMETGEVHGQIGADWDGLKASKPDWIQNQRIRVIMQLVRSRHPELSGVPTVLEYVKRDDDRMLLELFIDRLAYGRPLAAPPGTPASEVRNLRDGFAAMVQHEDFRKEAELLGATINVASGEEIAALIQRVYATPPQILGRAIQELQNANK
ncbi:MAG: hypothetical protein K2Y29_08070 [Beijerinckiaceae bacterium]|nr:hypothetical protein [Beijerinckiaceae bacterium]